MYFCGHSLGAAATALIAHDFSDHFDMELVLFGCPNIGGQDFHTRFASNNVLVYNYVIENDIVPKLPFEQLGYTPLTDVVLLDSAYDASEVLKNHSMHTYIDELERMISITSINNQIRSQKMF
jgi:hypothetical protein